MCSRTLAKDCTNPSGNMGFSHTVAKQMILSALILQPVTAFGNRFFSFIASCAMHSTKHHASCMHGFMDQKKNCVLFLDTVGQEPAQQH